MFEQFFQSGSKQQIKAEKESETRQLAASKEMTAINASTAEYQAELQEQERKVDLIKWQQDFDTDSLKRKLKNQIFDPNLGIWVMKKEKKKGQLVDMKPLMTEEGISAVENALSGFIGENARNLINSSLSEKQICRALTMTCNDLVHIFEYNFDWYFNEPTPSNMTLAMRIIKNEIKPTPFRALNGFTKRQDNTAIKRVETFSEQGQNDKKKMFGLV